MEISERKKSIIAILGNVAELGAARMEETIGAAGLRDAAIATGIATDKMLALTGQLPLVQIANVVLPTPEQDAQRQAIDRKLDEITRRLAAASYVLVVVVDVDVAIRPFASVTPGAAPGGAERNTSTKG